MTAKRLLVLGAGEMAAHHARAFAAIDGIELAGAVDPSADILAGFAKEFGLDHTFANLDEAIAWGEFDAATNVTPDGVHHATTMALIAAGKHVLCEKPLATNYADAIEMTEAAETAGLVNMVNFTYRASAVAAKARQLIADGAIGNLRHFDASYLQSWLVGRQWGDWRKERRWLWRLSRSHGSHGVVGDIGVHVIDLTTYVTGASVTRMQPRTATFDKAPGGRIGDYVLDANDTFAMSAELSDGAVGVIHATRWATGHANDLSLDVYGDRGGLRLRAGGPPVDLRICAGDDIHTGTWRQVDCPVQPTNYQRFATALLTGDADGPTFREAAVTQRILDLCLEAGDEGAPPIHIE